MKILIISDSHGEKDKVENILKEYKYDYFFFLGDGLNDISSIVNNKNVFAVKGNRDFLSLKPHHLTVEIEGIKFMLVHGFYEHVKLGLGSLLNKAKKENVNCVCFGHTHKYFNEIIDEIQFLNPGSLTNLRGGNSTFIMLDIIDKKFSTKKIQF